MRSLARHLYTVCSAVTLLLLMAICVLWVRTYWVQYQYKWVGRLDRDAYLRWVTLTHGNLFFERAEYLLNDDEPGRTFGESLLSQGGWSSQPVKPEVPSWRLALLPQTVQRSRQSRNYKITTYSYRCPLWIIAVPLALFPARRLLAARARRRRLRLRLCPTCGYDLRAGPGRCPECGAVPGVTT